VREQGGDRPGREDDIGQRGDDAEDEQQLVRDPGGQPPGDVPVTGVHRKLVPLVADLTRDQDREVTDQPHPQPGRH